MMSKNSYKVLLATFLALCMVCAAVPLHAKVTAEEAERLKKDLTPVGAERAGNADGTIPEWTGGLTKIPDNVKYDPSMGWIMEDPFSDDKVLFTITAQNMDQYADKLTPGLKAFFKKYPDTFKMNIYQTRRTAGFPQWVYDETHQNALETELIGDGTDGLTKGHGGFPFPISTNGCEMQYNHVLRYAGKTILVNGRTYTVYPDGSRVLASEAYTEYTFPWTRMKREEYIANEADLASNKLLVSFLAPARRKGEYILGYGRSNYTKGLGIAWSYMPGQRRCRRAPSIGYDTPNPSFGALGTYDQSTVWAGQPDRYDWSFKGKKEIFIPYNCYKFDTQPAEKLDDMLAPHHVNPEYVRWELHRVYVVQADLREGCRHVYKKRAFFMDEDSWIICLNDQYDNQDILWRTSMNMGKQLYQEGPDNIHYRMLQFDFHDFQVDNYVISGPRQEATYRSGTRDIPESVMTLSNLRKIGRR